MPFFLLQIKKMYFLLRQSEIDLEKGLNYSKIVERYKHIIYIEHKNYGFLVKQYLSYLISSISLSS